MFMVEYVAGAVPLLLSLYKGVHEENEHSSCDGGSREQYPEWEKDDWCHVVPPYTHTHTTIHTCTVSVWRHGKPCPGWGVVNAYGDGVLMVRLSFDNSINIKHSEKFNIKSHPIVIYLFEKPTRHVVHHPLWHHVIVHHPLWRNSTPSPMTCNSTPSPMTCNSTPSPMTCNSTPSPITCNSTPSPMISCNSTPPPMHAHPDPYAQACTHK